MVPAGFPEPSRNVRTSTATSAGGQVRSSALLSAEDQMKAERQQSQRQIQAQGGALQDSLLASQPPQGGGGGACPCTIL